MAAPLAGAGAAAEAVVEMRPFFLLSSSLRMVANLGLSDGSTGLT